MHAGTRLILSVLLVTAASGARTETRQEPSPLAPAMQTELADWLETHGRVPQRYVAGLFADHDVVFLGEYHRVKHDVLFVQSLVESLYEARVRTLALEFGRREDQPLIDCLLAKKDWDEDLAREVVFRSFVHWGYREYVDLDKAAWALNRRLPQGAPPFRILAINDSPDWSVVKTEADRDDGAIMGQVWRGGGEDQWAGIILDAVRAGEKVLVYSGIHHAFTEYRQPIVVDGRFLRFGDVRAGNHVFAALGKRAVTVFLHAPWSGEQGYASAERHPADGVIDALMLKLGPRAVGFDLKPGPFGELRVNDAVYRHGYEDFKLADFCDGWIYTKLLSEFEGVTPIPGWISEQNLERARSHSPNPALRQSSARELNDGMARDADIPRRWGHLR